MVVAKIDNYEITFDEYLAELHNVMQKFSLENPSPECKQRAIEHLIDGYLLLDQARVKNYTVNPDEIEEKLIDYIMQFKSQEDYNEMLDKSKICENSVRERLKDKILIQKYIQAHCAFNGDISEDRLIKLYEDNKEYFVTQEMVRASHILIKGTEEDCYLKAQEIRSTIKTVEDFKARAHENSHCPSGCQCGDLGYFPKGKMVKEFDEIAFSMKVHEISQPVKTEFGYHIIMLTDYKPSKVAEFQNIKNALVDRIKQIETELALLRHIKELRSRAKIEIYEDLL